MPAPLYEPGNGVSILAPRVEVITLQEKDLDDSLELWMGSEGRNEYIWKPQVSPHDYMSGLIRYCDNLRTFVFGIRLRNEGCIVGYRKVQIVPEDHGDGPQPTAIPTTVIGDTWAGQGYGQEAGHAANWFLTTYAGVMALSPRIYDANVQTWRLVERMGYRLSRTSVEPHQGGARKKVRHYVQTAEELSQRHGAMYEQLTMSVR